MWIKRAAYDQTVAELADQRARREAAERTLALTQQTVEWLRVQVNTLQYERASLLAKVTGAPVMVPTVQAVSSSPIAPPARQEPPDQFFNQLSTLFEDPGDEVARKLGIDHDADGGVVYTT